MTISEGATMTAEGTVINNGTIVVQGTLDGEDKITGDGTINRPDEGTGDGGPDDDPTPDTPDTPDTPSYPSNPPSYTIVRPDGFLASGAEYWAEAPKPETEKPAVDDSKDNPSMGGGHPSR